MGRKLTKDRGPLARVAIEETGSGRKTPGRKKIRILERNQRRTSYDRPEKGEKATHKAVSICDKKVSSLCALYSSTVLWTARDA